VFLRVLFPPFFSFFFLSWSMERRTFLFQDAAQQDQAVLFPPAPFRSPEVPTSVSWPWTVSPPLSPLLSRGYRRANRLAFQDHEAFFPSFQDPQGSTRDDPLFFLLPSCPAGNTLLPLLHEEGKETLLALAVRVDVTSVALPFFFFLPPPPIPSSEWGRCLPPIDGEILSLLTRCRALTTSFFSLSPPFKPDTPPPGFSFWRRHG